MTPCARAVAEQQRDQIAGLFLGAVQAETGKPHGRFVKRVEGDALCSGFLRRLEGQFCAVFIHCHWKPRLRVTFEISPRRKAGAGISLCLLVVVAHWSDAQQLMPFFFSRLQASMAVFWSSKPPKRAR
jgi:hypothetical protein